MFRKTIPQSKTYTRAVSRLKTVSYADILSYLDNAHSHMGKLLSETRKSLIRKSPDEADNLLEDIAETAEVIRAASDVLRSRKKEIKI